MRQYLLRTYPQHPPPPPILPHFLLLLLLQGTNYQKNVLLLPINLVVLMLWNFCYFCVKLLTLRLKSTEKLKNPTLNAPKSSVAPTLRVSGQGLKMFRSENLLKFPPQRQ